MRLSAVLVPLCWWYLVWWYMYEGMVKGMVVCVWYTCVVRGDSTGGVWALCGRSGGLLLLLCRRVQLVREGALRPPAPGLPGTGDSGQIVRPVKVTSLC